MPFQCSKHLIQYFVVSQNSKESINNCIFCDGNKPVTEVEKLPTCKYEAAGLEAEKAERREKLDGC